jgi:glyceraldehyde 3-phosphate dehydrogenase
MGTAIPELNRELSMAFHVSILSVAIVDMTHHLVTAAKNETGIGGSPKGYPGLCWGQVVACVFNSNMYSSTFDAGAGIALNDNVVKPISWYGNKYSYSNRGLDLMVHTTFKEKDHPPQQEQEEERGPWLTRNSCHNSAPNTLSTLSL